MIRHVEFQEQGKYYLFEQDKQKGQSPKKKSILERQNIK